MSDLLRRAGEVNLSAVSITSANGVSFDVTPQVLSIELTENLFEPFTTGVISITDTQNLTNIFPLVGSEYCNITFKTPTLPDSQGYDKQFFIYAVTDKLKLTERNTYYQLKIISMEAITDRLNRISKTFRGSPSDIIIDLVQNSGLKSDKSIICENAMNQIAFISNWWSPTKCIRYTCAHSFNANKSPSFLFFENRIGFMYATLDQLCSSEPVQTFYIDNYNNNPTDNKDSTVATDIQRQFQSVRRYTVANGFDYFKRIDSGYYGSETIGWDPVTQQYTHIANNRKFESDNHLNKYNPISKYAPVLTSAYLHYIPYATQNFEGQNRGVDDSDLIYRGERQQLFSKLNTTRFELNVWGRTDYTVGLVVSLSVTKDQQIEKGQDPKDHLLSGNYLITSIKHVVNLNEHTCNIQLMKDSYITDISNSTI